MKYKQALPHRRRRRRRPCSLLPTCSSCTSPPLSISLSSRGVAAHQSITINLSLSVWAACVAVYGVSNLGHGSAAVPTVASCPLADSPPPYPTPPPFLSGCRCLVRRFRPSVLCFSPLFVRPGPHLDEDTGINVPRGVGDGATRSPPPWGAGAPQGAFLLLLLYFSHGVGAC